MHVNTYWQLSGIHSLIVLENEISLAWDSGIWLSDSYDTLHHLGLKLVELFYTGIREKCIYFSSQSG